MALLAWEVSAGPVADEWIERHGLVVSWGEWVLRLLWGLVSVGAFLGLSCGRT
jgi:hypothetical protein